MLPQEQLSARRRLFQQLNWRSIHFVGRMPFFVLKLKKLSHWLYVNCQYLSKWNQISRLCNCVWKEQSQLYTRWKQVWHSWFQASQVPTQLVPGHHYGQLVQYLDKNLSIPTILENPMIDNNIDKKLNTFLVLIAVFLDFLIYHLKSGKIDCSFALQKGLVTSHRSKFNLLHGVCSRWADRKSVV